MSKFAVRPGGTENVAKDNVPMRVGKPATGLGTFFEVEHTRNAYSATFTRPHLNQEESGSWRAGRTGGGLPVDLPD